MSWWGEDRCDRLVVIGLGQIGASVGLAARSVSAAAAVIGHDLNGETAAEALALGAVTELAATPEEAVERADLVVLAAPVLEIVGLVARVASSLGPRCILTDVGSVKAPVVDAMARTGGCSARCLGGHPMAGGESPGPGAARPDLFRGRTWVLCPGAATRADAVQTARRFVSLLGSIPLIMDAADHDREVAFTSHLPYLAAVGTCLALREHRAAGEAWKLVGGGLRDCTRVALSSPEMAGSFCLANRQELVPAARNQALWMERLAAALDSGDEQALQGMLSGGRDFRAGIRFHSAGDGER